MRRWFLSYHSPDQALAERLKAALERKDTGARVFFAPSSLRAGGFWSRTLAEEIAQADAFILLVGEKGVGDWQVLEYDEALDKRVKLPDFPLILVLLDGQTAPGLPFLRRLHWIISPDPSSEKDVARLFDAASGTGARPGELWRYTSPYRGLAAMEEKDSDYFFGREEKTVEVINSLATASGQLVILLGNSGVGKSSVAQAGVLAALKRQAWPERADAAPEWPDAFRESRRWCFLTLKPGSEPVRALVEPFLWTWQFDAVDPRRAELLSSWVSKLIDGKVTLRDLLDATEARYRDALHQPKPPAFLLYVDQGEELYVRAEERQRPRFSEVIAQGVSDPRLYILMSMRSDFLGELQKDEPLYKVHRQINVPPLREPELRQVVSLPAELLSARFEIAELADIISHRAAEDSVKDVGALPLLSYTLDDMWTQMVKRDDGVLRLPAQSFELGGVLVNRADAFLAAHPNAEDHLRRMFTLKLATVREGEEPTRRRALRSEFTDEEWRLVNELADHPYRLLVTVTPGGGETYAEVVHETIFRRWGKLRDWIAAEREFLAWKSGLEFARRTWLATPPGLKSDALLRGFALKQARNWLAKRSKDILINERDFIVLSYKRMQWRRLRIPLVVLALIAVVTGWWQEQWLRERSYWLLHAHPISAAQEQDLKPGADFKECADCPEIVVLPAGNITMGSLVFPHEQPLHTVTIERPFAVAKFELTFAEWDACAAHGDCAREVPDQGWGRGRQPVVNVSWDDALRYVAWLRRVTGKNYRLLSEAEWEYAARAGSVTHFWYGDDDARLGRYAWYAADPDRHPHPVGKKDPNPFGLYDMHGNVSEWVDDCYFDNYAGAPFDGSSRRTDNCTRHVIRGGSYLNRASVLRSAARDWSKEANDGIGIRVARSLVR